MIPHSWLIKCLEIYGAEENNIRLLKNTMPNWKTILTSSGTRLAEINIRRGIFQGDSLSPLLLLTLSCTRTRFASEYSCNFNKTVMKFESK